MSVDPFWFTLSCIGISILLTIALVELAYASSEQT